LSDLRQNLRQRMLSSDLCNAQAFVPQLEGMYSRLFQQWKEGGWKKWAAGSTLASEQGQQQQQQQQRLPISSAPELEQQAADGGGASACPVCAPMLSCSSQQPARPLAPPPAPSSGGGAIRLDHAQDLLHLAPSRSGSPDTDVSDGTDADVLAALD
jgi:hypothetical protein